MDSYFNSFNNEQQNAIFCQSNTVCVYAGPGTGKTKTLVGKYIYLRSVCKVKAHNILCITFTKKAAEEMKKRISLETDDEVLRYVCTLHSLCHRILSTDIYRIGYVNKYTILNDEDQKNILYDLMIELSLFNEDKITFKDAISYISKEKTKMRYIDLMLDISLLEEQILKINESLLNESGIEKKLEKLFLLYLKNQCINYYLDYQDLILVTIHLFKNNDQILKKWSSKFNYILVDEFQDLTRAECELIECLATEHKNIFGVGDPDQSIYSFRGSDVKVFNDFYENADERFDFKINYRSYQEIIDFSHSLIQKNKNRVTDLLLNCTRSNSSTYPKIVHCKDSFEQPIFIVSEIENLIKSGYKYSDMAILYRNNSCSLPYEEYFRLNGIPYRVFSNSDFFKSDEIKTALAYMRFVLYKDNESFLKIYRKPTRYISNIMLNRIKEHSKMQNISYWDVIVSEYNDKFYNNRLIDFYSLISHIEMDELNYSFSEWTQNLFEKSGFMKYVLSSGDEEKANNIKHLLDMIKLFEDGFYEGNIIDEFLNYVALLSDGDVKDESNKIQLMSIHASKGLEFPIVFISDFIDGIIPSSKIESLDDLYEERRILYVAITRAKDKLYLINHKESEGDRKTSDSIFYKDFSNNLYNEFVFINNSDYEREKISLCSCVKSKLYGKGVVKCVDYENQTCDVKFDDYFTIKTVNYNSLIIYNPSSVSVLFDNIVKNQKECYNISNNNLVLHKKYGFGFVTDILNNNVLIKFKNIKAQFNLYDKQIIKVSAYGE